MRVSDAKISPGAFRRHGTRGGRGDGDMSREFIHYDADLMRTLMPPQEDVSAHNNTNAHIGRARSKR